MHHAWHRSQQRAWKRLLPSSILELFELGTRTPTAAMLATNKARIPDMSTLVVFQCSTKDVLQYISTNFDSLLVLKSTPSNHMFDRGFHAKHSTRDASLCLSFSLFHLLRSARWQVCGFVLRSCEVTIDLSNLLQRINFTLGLLSLNINRFLSIQHWKTTAI